MSTIKNDETSDVLRKVSHLVASMVDPVTAALEEIEAARHTRRRAVTWLTFAIVCSFCVQFWILGQNHERTDQLKKIGERQQAHFEHTAKQVEALLSFAQSQTKNERLKAELKSAQQLPPETAGTENAK